MYKQLIPLAFIFLLSACFPKMTPEKMVLGSFKTGGAEVEWSNRSSAYGDAPNLITIKNNGKADTILVSTNVAAIKPGANNAIIIGFYGQPRLYENIIKVPQSIHGYAVSVDTTYTHSFSRSVH